MEQISERDPEDKVRFLIVSRTQLGEIASHGRTLFAHKAEELTHKREEAKYGHIVSLWSDDSEEGVGTQEGELLRSTSEDTVLSHSPSTTSSLTEPTSASLLDADSVSIRRGRSHSDASTGPSISSSVMEPTTLSSKLVPDIPNITPHLTTDVAGKLNLMGHAPVSRGKVSLS